MRPLLKLNIFFLLFALFLYNPTLITSQVHVDKTILFEKSDSKVNKIIYQKDDKVYFLLNGDLVSTISVNQKYFNLINSPDGQPICLASYYFGKKEEKSFIEIYLFDEDFKVSFYRKLNLFYEEPFPKILPLSSDKVLLYTTATGVLRILHSKTEKEIKLLKDEENEFFQERIGHILEYGNKLFLTLSQIKKNNDFISIVYLIDQNNYDIKEFELDIDIINKIFLVNSSLYFTGIDIEPVFDGGFYRLEINDLNFSESKILKISDVVIEGQIRNKDDLIYSKDCFYGLRQNDNLELLNCIKNEIILDALWLRNKLFVVTRQDLSSYFYELSQDFIVLNRELIDHHLVLPKIEIVSDKRLKLMDRNKTIIVKNISEE